jgi:iron-sulfur cluster assembly protein
MALFFTEIAAHQVQHYLTLRGQGLGVRLAVQTTECGDLDYQLEFVDQAQEYDLVFESHGARIYIDPKSLMDVDGTTIDFSMEGSDQGFRVHNPNITHQCGCGGSFQA